MTDLVEFLRARLDEDEQVARNAAADNPTWTYDPERFAVYTDGYPIASHRFGDSLADVDGMHIARHDPARVLREVEAKRRILNAYTVQVAERQRIGVLHDAELATGGEDSLDVAELMGKGIRANTWISHLGWVLRVLAVAYADHPDYREEWRP